MLCFKTTIESASQGYRQHSVVGTGSPALTAHPLFTSVKGIFIGIIIVSLIVIIG